MSGVLQLQARGRVTGGGGAGLPFHTPPRREQEQERGEARLSRSSSFRDGALRKDGTEWHVRECDAYAGLESVGLSEFQSAWGGFRKIPQLTPWALSLRPPPLGPPAVPWSWGMTPSLSLWECGPHSADSPWAGASSTAQPCQRWLCCRSFHLQATSLTITPLPDESGLRARPGPVPSQVWAGIFLANE